MVSWLASSFLVRNCPFYFTLMEIITLQLLINTLFLLMSMMRPFKDIILLPINKLALKPLTK